MDAEDGSRGWMHTWLHAPAERSQIFHLILLLLGARGENLRGWRTGESAVAWLWPSWGWDLQGLCPRAKECPEDPQCHSSPSLG